MLAVCCPFSGSGQYSTRPNILLIVSEDHGPHLSCYGDTNIRTPNLDRVAQQGILFRNAYVTESVCSPSRSSILTGLYPHQSGHLGLTTHGFHFVGPVQTVYALLKQAGYRTGMIGKLHLEPASLFPIDDHPISDPNYNKKGLERYAAYAERFMQAADTPFFLMVNFPDTHWPYQDVVEGRPQQPVTADQVRSFPYIGFDNERIRNYTKSIYNCMLRLDECVGELMEKLNTSGKAANTLIIFLSDHGDEMARGKFDIYEASNKVPLMAVWPGRIKKGIESKALVSSVDIVPTILELAGLPAAENLTGKSLVPLFARPAGPYREYLFTEKNADQIGMYYPRRAVRDRRYKLICSLLDDGRENEVAVQYTRNSKKPRTDAVAGSPTREELKSAPDSIRQAYHDWIRPSKFQLYDLEKDPFEFHDLSADVRYTAIKERLTAALFRWQQDTDDPLRFPDKLAKLTQENDTMKVATEMRWHYPEYLYNKTSDARKK
nr:sulfatase [Niabella beijingensis]